MSLTNLRLEPSYPNAKSPTSFQDGLEFQDFVCSELAKCGVILQNLSSKKWQYTVGENLQGFEIKKDDPHTRTGRLSIEVAEKSKADDGAPWVSSGIMRDDNTWLYIQGNYEQVYVFPKNWLRRYYIEKSPETFEKFGTIRTFYLPLAVAEKCAAKVIKFKDAA